MLRSPATGDAVNEFAARIGGEFAVSILVVDAGDGREILRSASPTVGDVQAFDELVAAGRAALNGADDDVHFEWFALGTEHKAPTGRILLHRFEDDRWFLFEHQIFVGLERRSVELFRALDVTEAERMQREIASLERSRRRIVEYTGDAFYLADQEGYPVDVNKAACDMLGYTRDEFMRVRFTDIETSPMLSDWRGVLFSMPLETPIIIQGRHRRKDGRVVPVEVTTYTFEEGGRRFMTGLARDVEKRLAMEEDLRRGVEHVRNVLEATTDGFFESDAGLVCTYINDKALRLFGQKGESMLGRDVTEFFPPERREALRVRLSRVIEDRRTAEFEYRDPRLDAWFQCRCYPTRGSLSVYLLDVTARKKTEIALKKAKEAAEAAARAKSEFLAAVSHELRSPLHLMLGSAELLGESSLDPEQRRLLDMLAGSGLALEGLVDDVLDLTRLDAGRLKLRNIPFDPAAAVRGVVEGRRAAGAQRNLQLDCVIDASLPRCCLGDPLRLSQVLTNLVDNAVKFSKDGTVTVTVSAERFDAAGDRVRLDFAVGDDGPGIAPDFLPRAFERFAQGPNAVEGAGLGLAMCKSLVERMGGGISLHPGPVRGLLVRFWLPSVVKSDADVADLAPATVFGRSRGGRSDQTPKLDSLRVLVVDDVAGNRELVKLYLEDPDAAVIVDQAANGTEAASLFTERVYDVVLMDAVMPGEDGPEVIRRLRRFEAESGRPRAFMAALTARAFPEDRIKSLAAGCDEHLAKPVSKAALVSLLASRPRRLASPEEGASS